MPASVTMGWYKDAFGYRSESPLPYIKPAAPTRRDRITELKSSSPLSNNEKAHLIEKSSLQQPSKYTPVVLRTESGQQPSKIRLSGLAKSEKAHHIEQEAIKLPNENASVSPVLETKHRRSRSHSRNHTPESERRHRVHREGYHAARKDSKNSDAVRPDTHVRYEEKRHEDRDPLITKTTPAKESRTTNEKQGRKAHHSRRRSPYPVKE
ncbi:hypothetical protein GLAREA_11363 [Glarea lozoyensis ATCC 20868]|uniref:Uncharacterized protein n=1 Tax=Glarea lozoyensis (strain ATCC 20868 / MF5171) TaxID=1116229 RepID=S3EBH9_GLAL2|nr:uncharacterized protein GLAREA_11363 [Glarea lozoyensis ATCC 20868]EPE35663.1 hypothetical protein GLAREA_11363 [Glarea lozoyensis ATCC 20868]